MPTHLEPTGAALICTLLILVMPLGSLSAVEAGRITWEELGGITIIVAADGSGDYTHIQWAIENASVGDTILVRAGEYYETLYIDKSLHIIGDGADRTYIHNSTNNWEPLVELWASGTLFRGFNLSRTTFSNGIGIHIVGVSHCRVEECVISGFNTGLYSEISGSLTIAGNEFSDCYSGLSLVDSDNVTVSSNDFRGWGSAIELRWSYDCRIYGNTMNRSGIRLLGGTESLASHVVTTNNTVKGRAIQYWVGLSDDVIPEGSGQVYLIGCSNITVRELNISYVDVGVQLVGSDNCTIESNGIASQGSYNILLEMSPDNLIHNNMCSMGHNGGITVRNSYRCIATNNTVEEGGVSLSEAHRIKLVGNTINGSGYFNVLLSDTFGADVTGNVIREGYFGVVLEVARNINLSANLFFNNTDTGISVWLCQNTTIEDNVFSSNGGDGAAIYQSRVTNIINNTCAGSGDGISTYWSRNSTYRDNNFTGCGIALGGNSWPMWISHEIDTSNTVNGKPLIYWKNREGGTVPPDAGQIILANCTGVTVSNQNISNTYAGLFTVRSRNITVRDNAFHDNTHHGYYVVNCSGMDIFGNLAWNNTQTGFRLHMLNDSFVTNDTAKGCDRGYFLTECNRNDFSGLASIGNRMGIYVASSKNNTLHNSRIADNTGSGIYFSYLPYYDFQDSNNDNHFHTNVIANNTGPGVDIQAMSNTWNHFYNNVFDNNNGGRYQALDEGFLNTWDLNGGGNWWSDH